MSSQKPSRKEHPVDNVSKDRRNIILQNNLTNISLNYIGKQLSRIEHQYLQTETISMPEKALDKKLKKSYLQIL